MENDIYIYDKTEGKTEYSQGLINYGNFVYLTSQNNKGVFTINCNEVTLTVNSSVFYGNENCNGYIYTNEEVGGKLVLKQCYFDVIFSQNLENDPGFSEYLLMIRTDGVFNSFDALETFGCIITPEYTATPTPEDTTTTNIDETTTTDDETTTTTTTTTTEEQDITPSSSSISGGNDSQEGGDDTKPKQKSSTVSVAVGVCVAIVVVAAACVGFFIYYRKKNLTPGETLTDDKETSDGGNTSPTTLDGENIGNNVEVPPVTMLGMTESDPFENNFEEMTQFAIKHLQ